MQAVLVNHRYHPFHGGSEAYIQALAEWFAACGWGARVVTTDAYDLEYFWDARKRSVGCASSETLNGVDIRRLPVAHPPMAPVLFQGGRRLMGEASRALHTPQPFAAAAARLPHVPGLATAILDHPRPDVVVAANLGLEGLPQVAAAAAAEMDVPFVLLPFAHVGRQDDDVARRYVSMPHQRALLWHADLIIALTEFEARFLCEIGARPGSIVVAGAGVELPAHMTCDTRNDDRELTILCAGAMAHDKGTPDVVAASMQLAAEGMRHRLVLIGPSLSAFDEWLAQSGAAECDWINVLGVVANEVKAQLFREADLFVLPSRTESFGIVYLEAWAERVPVIGADVGAVAEVISDGIDGRLVPFGDRAALASAVRELATRPALRKRMGEAGYAKVREKYTWDKVLERIADGFSRIIGIEVA